MNKTVMSFIVALAVSAQAKADIQMLDFHGFTLAFDKQWLTVVGQEEQGNNGVAYFNLNWQALSAVAGEEREAEIDPIFEVKAKTDSYLISYRGEVESRALKRNGARVDFNTAVAADLHGGFSSDDQLVENALLSSEDTGSEISEIWHHSFEQSFFGATTDLTLNGLGRVHLSALNADSFAEFSVLNQQGQNQNAYQFCLSIGSVQPVPEPETLVLFAMGLPLLAWARRRTC